MDLEVPNLLSSRSGIHGVRSRYGLVVADPAAHLGRPDAQNTPPFSGASTPESPAGRALRDKAPRSPKRAAVQDSYRAGLGERRVRRIGPRFSPHLYRRRALPAQEEEVNDGFLLVYGNATGAEYQSDTDATALITIVGMSQSVFGYPNEEAFWYDSRGDLGKGFYELRGSTWLHNVTAYNTRTRESRHLDQRLDGKYVGALHFFVASKDVSAQFLAQGLRVEVFQDRPFKAVRDEAIRRLDGRAQNLGTFFAGDRPVRSYPEEI